MILTGLTAPLVHAASGWGGVLLVAGGVLVAVAVGLRLYGWHVYEVQTTEEGVVTFIAPLHRTQLTAHDIRRLTGYYVPDYYGEPIWHMEIKHVRGRYKFGVFEGVVGLVDLIGRHNPEVVIRGEWPMGPPAVPGGNRPHHTVQEQ
jgi:hypothetical protein